VTSGASIDRPISLRKHQNSKAGAFFADRAGAPPESTKWSKMTHLRQILRLPRRGRFSFAGFRVKALGGTSGNRCRPAIPAVECATTFQGR